MIVRQFNRLDNAYIAEWFQDSESVQWLESAWSETELDQMALEENGRQYVATEEGQIIASIGCYLPTPAFDRYVISYVHVAPWCRRQGIASALVDWLLQKQGPGCSWRCYIDPANERSMRLFSKHQWQRLGDEPGENGMYIYEICT
jgi:ribosomal protein S18 acetylase RimI-like enzyme